MDSASANQDENENEPPTSAPCKQTSREVLTSLENETVGICLGSSSQHVVSGINLLTMSGDVSVVESGEDHNMTEQTSNGRSPVDGLEDTDIDTETRQANVDPKMTERPLASEEIRRESESSPCNVPKVGAEDTVQDTARLKQQINDGEENHVDHQFSVPELTTCLSEMDVPESVSTDAESLSHLQQPAQRSPSPEELVVMEEIFEPRPSTSRDSGLNRIGGSPNVSVTTIPEAEPVVVFEPPKREQGERKQSLKFLPRNTQYEKHPLLQIRSDSGLSEFDLLLMERNTSSSHARTFSLEEPLSSDQHKVSVLRRKLVPRSAHYEKNPLFEKTESGLSQLEQYLQEKDQEIAETSSTSQEMSCISGHSIMSPGAPLSITTTESGIGTLSESSNVSASSNASPVPSKEARAKDDISLVPALLEIQSAEAKRKALVHSKSVPETYNPPTVQLQPRQDQYQAHHLLQHKDDKGMSELQTFLQEMEDEFKEKGKCSTKCTCKNINCSKCKVSSPRTLTKEVDMLTRIEPKSNNKRVHFQRQECVEQTADKEKESEQTDQTSPTADNKREDDAGPDSSVKDQPPEAARGDDENGASQQSSNTTKDKTSKKSTKSRNPKCVLS